MPEKPDIRSYCNPWPPRHSEQSQLARLTGELYIEDKTGRVIEALIRSIRKGSIIEVVETGLLAPIIGKPFKRRRLMAEYVELIKAKGGAIVEVETGSDSRKGHLPRMLIRGAEFIATSGRMNSKKGKKGRPRKDCGDHKDIIAACWFSRKYANDEERLTAIQKRTGKWYKRSWVWANLGSPHKRDE